MKPLSHRCEGLREKAVNSKPLNPRICGQREFYFTQGLAEVPPEKRTNSFLIASGIASIILHAPAIIQEDELIVGYNYGDGSYEIFWPGNDLNADLLEQGQFTAEQTAWYLQHSNEIHSYLRVDYPEYSLSQKDIELDQEMASLGGCLTSNHSVIGYEKVLKQGFSGLAAEIEPYLLAQEPNDFYASMKLICDAGCHFGERYAAEAQKRLANCQEPARRADLETIITTCSQVPRYPARSFREAIQSLWFAHIINTWEDGINANSLGRLDQILYPYYTADIEKGLLTQEEAFELICCLWIKLYRDYDVQQSCVGGCDSHGNSAINELSYLMLDATEALNFVRCLSVRFSPATDKRFIQRALEVVGHVQKGIPFFFNDDVYLKSLTSHGISYEDATGYTQIGCVETVIPGKSNPHAVTARCNLLKALEYTLGNGYSLVSPELCPGLETGDPLAFTTYEALKQAVFSQIKNIIEASCRMVVRVLHPAAVTCPRPYKSLLTEGCLASGKDFNERGAKYDYYQVMLLGIPNLADSLAAMRTLIFDQKRYTLAQLIEQLKADFPDEAFRLDFVNKAPKYGNDIDAVDQIAVELTNYACDCLEALSAQTGLDFHAQPFTFLWMVDHGRLTAATPDGRHKGEILAYSVSPMQGRDFTGFTALMNSLAKLPTARTPGSSSAIVEIDPKLFTDRNLPFFVDILLSAAQKGLCNVQFNTIDADTLIAAQKYPDKYKNLAVRVSGFSQKFYLLDKTMQDHIISRTKHTAL